MSRIGRKPVAIPSGVSVTVGGTDVTVKGPKGALTIPVPSMCKVALEGNEITVTRSRDEKFARASHGTTRAHLNNMVKGVTTGFTKELEIVGVGYKAEAKGQTLTLTIGFSHLVNFPAPQGITVETPEPTKIKVTGIDRQKVGQVAADIRGIRPPEPYKGNPLVPLSSMRRNPCAMGMPILPVNVSSAEGEITGDGGALLVNVSGAVPGA